LIARFVIWNEQTRLGKVFDSSTCFRLPKGGDRSPDVAWIEQSRWDSLTSDQKRKFPPICPDFVLELLSPTDSLKLTQSKMQEYMNNGCRLGWLISPDDQRLEIYQAGQAVQVLNSPTSISGDPVLPDFSLDLQWLW
ncbi:MAG: Uma2 family endonuclease, partial [Cyanobacteria bacterium P01_H01_bin.121]